MASDEVAIPAAGAGPVRGAGLAPGTVGRGVECFCSWIVWERPPAGIPMNLQFFMPNRVVQSPKPLILLSPYPDTFGPDSPHAAWRWSSPAWRCCGSSPRRSPCAPPRSHARLAFFPSHALRRPESIRKCDTKLSSCYFRLRHSARRRRNGVKSAFNSLATLA